MAGESSTHTAVEGHLPLKPVVFHVLLALVEGELHGYGVIQAVRERSEGRIQLQTGPFYRHLKKLMDAGLVEESSAPPEQVDPRRGSHYRLSPLGRQVVAAEANRLAVLVSVSQSLGLMDGGAGQ